ncbi:beta-glucanase (GH16 family) [Marmoricola sp. OAE513]|uniref:glycoside hydrolase family 16 protein n=1 Tax=Marmoricola sp. OAE513 TaxID=2817894 RepID=UPI001AE7F280
MIRGRHAQVAGLAVALLAVLVSGLFSFGGASNAASALPDKKPKPIWRDEFSGKAGSAPSSRTWTAQVGGNGWGNGEVQCYTNSRTNSHLNGKGVLVISARRQPGHTCANGTTNDYTSARLVTLGKMHRKYGRILIRAKVPAGNGVWPAFWAIGADEPKVKWPRSGEFDVLEALGRKPKMLKTTLHGVDAQGNHRSVTKEGVAKKKLSKGWHVYGLTWTRKSFTATYDGKVYAKITKKQVRRTGMLWSFDKPFYFVLNLAIGGGYAGPVAAGTTRKDFLIDWIRVYKR